VPARRATRDRDELAPLFKSLGKTLDISYMYESWCLHEQLTSVVTVAHILADEKRVEVKAQNYTVGWG
jgi:hypothetical protein